MLIPTTTTVAAKLTSEFLARRVPDEGPDSAEAAAFARNATEPGFEIAQSMGIALLGLVVAAAFATALEALGVDVVTRIRSELGL